MKLRNNETKISSRWLLLSASVAMMAAGYGGVRLFEWLSHSHPVLATNGNNFGINNNDLFALFCFLVAIFGLLLFLIAGVWIILSFALSFVRQLNSKKENIAGVSKPLS